MTDVYTLAVAETARIVAGIGDDQLDKPTPCAEFTVRAEVNHLYQAVDYVIDVAEGKDIDLSWQRDLLVGDWRGGFAATGKRMAEALADPSVPDGPPSNVGLTRSQVAELALSELLIHGWDLAVATGQEYRPHPEVVAHVGRFHDGGPNELEPPGSFAETVPVAEGAPLLDRILGGLGRDPGWSAAGVGGSS